MPSPLSSRAARSLLANAHSATGLRLLVRALGFTSAEHRLAPRPLTVLGLATNPAIRASRFTRNDDIALLLVEQVDATHWRDTLRRLATRLDRLTDHRRWLVILHCTHAHETTLAIACWLSSTRGPRLAVLTTAPTHVLDSDAQTIAALAAAWHPDPTLTCLRWHDLLGRHAIGRRFFRELDAHVAAIADNWPARVHADDRRTLALIHVARLLFLKFLETKGWLDNDRAFLARHAEDTLASGGRLWHRLIAPLTFGTLNTPRRHRAPTARAFGDIPFLNGGLFACSATERRARHPSISDELLAPLLLDTLARFRFTAREEAQTWQEAAIDPDLLGKTFESLMDESQRRGSGTFYTPAALVSSLVDDALRHALHPPLTLAALDDFRVLDPACGSGSLLVATLEHLTTLRQQLGDTRPVATIRRHVLTHSIFGVDIAPMAVWLCELRLWLSIVIDDETTTIPTIAPLPNLDHHIRIGDSLGQSSFENTPSPKSLGIAAIRERYAHSTGARKRTCAARIETVERNSAHLIATRTITALRTERTELLQLARQHTLFGTRHGLSTTQRRRLTTLRTLITEQRRTLRRIDDGGTIDFDFRTHFSDAATAGGFDLVIGNPPWVRSQHLDSNTRLHLRTRFADVTRHANGNSAFGVQTDIAIPFTHRALDLTRPGGILAFLLPAKLWRSVAAGALRHHLLQHATPKHLRDYSADAGGFSAAVYPSTIVLQRTLPTPDMTNPHTGSVDCHATDAAGHTHDFRIATHALAASPEPGAPWRIVPDTVRHAANLLNASGSRWLDTVLPSPTLGVKTGCNDAFLIDDSAIPDALRPWTRPVLRGDHVQAWHCRELQTSIVIPHDDNGLILKRLPAPLARHFAPHERALVARTDLRPREPWWTLFRTDLIANAGWRVVWADIGRTLRATVLPPHTTTVPLNTCYGVRLHDPVDAHTLAALLNAPTTTAFLSLIAEPARGGYHRFLGWTVQALPIPPWHRAREVLAPIAARARRGETVNADTLHHSTLDAYGITHTQVAPLLDWTAVTLADDRTSTPRSA